MADSVPISSPTLLHFSLLHLCTYMLLLLNAQPSLPQCYFAPHVKYLYLIRTYLLHVLTCL